MKDERRSWVASRIGESGGELSEEAVLATSVDREGTADVDNDDAG